MTVVLKHKNEDCFIKYDQYLHYETICVIIEVL